MEFVTKYSFLNVFSQTGKNLSQNKIVAISILIFNFWPYVTKGIDLKWVINISIHIPWIYHPPYHQNLNERWMQTKPKPHLERSNLREKLIFKQRNFITNYEILLIFETLKDIGTWPLVHDQFWADYILNVPFWDFTNIIWFYNNLIKLMPNQN